MTEGNMVSYIPRVLADESLVDGFSDLEHSAIVRMLPLLESEDGTSDLPGAGEASKHEPMSGECDRHSIGTILRILTEVVPGLRVSTDVTFAMWPGYAGELGGAGPVSVFGHDAPLPFGRYGGLAIKQAPLNWLSSFSVENPGRPHMPVYVWPEDGSFLISCPIYSNSLFISGGELLAEKLEESALDAVRVERGSLLNCRDDLD